ncbi:MAG: hypothetical protein R2824_31180 [Saprospiraceae bacterium]
MSGISAFADKSTEQATLKICDLLEEIERPEGVRMTVNNLSNAESGVLRTKDENPVIDISLSPTASPLKTSLQGDQTSSRKEIEAATVYAIT